MGDLNRFQGMFKRRCSGLQSTPCREEIKVSLERPYVVITISNLLPEPLTEGHARRDDAIIRLVQVLARYSVAFEIPLGARYRFHRLGKP